jgi:group I intron endonuclease
LIVYIARNKITDKVYVGQTTVSLAERKGDHKRKSQIHNSKSYFHSAIRKYGFGNFSWKTIDKADSRKELNKSEKYWIKHYKSNTKEYGYNLTSGGDTIEFNDEVKQKIGASQKGTKRSKEFKKKISAVTKGRLNPFYGKRHTPETKIKCGIKNIGRKHAPEHIAKCVHIGSKNHKAKINESIAYQVKTMLRSGIRPCDIQRSLKVSKGIVMQIKHNKTWRHVAI